MGGGAEGGELVPGGQGEAGGAGRGLGAGKRWAGGFRSLDPASVDQQPGMGLVTAAGLTRKCPRGHGRWGRGARAPQLHRAPGRGLPARPGGGVGAPVLPSSVWVLVESL